ncbi:inositol monophosphatase family protein [Methylocaldum szegediense]|jgi:myo-inositol-1(or 4)-monophosphatase|uniref:Myo-inositol-1(Or 4)-monophosphatase n=1 Tax=Methylocaldum szegediense TaxID=73780 RepID=A0ABM9HZE6_9GAMM|nr:inositol monophosphatase family protein [Methylocaldum szegediense]CAI8787184.1 myo-inositol-1(or 4)-monophosphatase [Methylocaldum szegediense]
MLPHLDDLATLVKAAAREELLPRFAGTERLFKADGSVVTEADFAVQKRLTARLQERYPEFALLSEEMDALRQQELLEQDNAGLWCLDPLDGTSNFTAGLPFFTISLALLIEHKPVLGIVYDPIRDECFTAQRDLGAWLNGVRLRVPSVDLPLRRCLAVVDFKRLGPLAAKLAVRPPYSSQRNLGSVALEWCWLAAGRFHVYLHGKQKLWDYAAGALILSEAGGRAETLRGEPIFSIELQPRSVVAAGDRRLFDEWKTWLTECSDGIGSP